jgi:hypothetical protein
MVSNDNKQFPRKQFAQNGDSSPYRTRFRKWQRTIFCLEQMMIVSKTLSRAVLMTGESWSYRGRSPSVAIPHQMFRVRLLLLNGVMCPIGVPFAWIRTNRAKLSPGPPVAGMHFTRIVWRYNLTIERSRTTFLVNRKRKPDESFTKACRKTQLALAGRRV